MNLACPRCGGRIRLDQEDYGALPQAHCSNVLACGARWNDDGEELPARDPRPMICARTLARHGPVIPTIAHDLAP